MKKFRTVLLLALSVAASSAALADDLTGVDVFLCTAQTASVCTLEGDCMNGTPGVWNIPQFIVVEVGAKRLRTTKASGESRSTPIANVQRNDGTIFLQGIERGRAFSFQIDELTGEVSVAVAREGFVVAVFGVCTPGTSNL